MLRLTLTLIFCYTPPTVAAPAHCTRQEATDFQAPGSKCPSKPCADLGGDGSSGHGFGAADAQACCQLCADYKGNEECKYAVYQAGATNKNQNCFLKAAPVDAIVGGPGNLGMELLPPSSEWGSTLLVMLFLVSAGYVGVGVLVGIRTSGKTGLGAHPHYKFWASLYGLVVDGGSAVRSASSRSRSSQQRSVRYPEGHYRSIAEAKQLQPVQRSTKHKKKSSDAKEKKRKGGMRSGSKCNKEEQTAQIERASATAPQAAQPSAESRSKASAAAGGGRWVHVPN